MAEAEALLGYLVAVSVLSLEHGGLMAEIDEFFVLPAGARAGRRAALLAAPEAALRTRRVRLQLQLGVTATQRARASMSAAGYRGRAGYALLDKPLR